MSRTRARLLIAAVALVHAALFIIYQRPDWQTQWSDQSGYLLLGRVLASTGRFTRFPATPAYVPETMRTPLYPAFIGGLDLMFGESHTAIAAAQGVLFASVCVIVHGLALTVASEGVALAAGLAVALYPPLPYYSALALTETLATFLVTAGLAVWLAGLRRRSIALCAGSGIVLAAAALTRPTFALLPLFLAAAAVVPRHLRRFAARGGAAMIGVFGAVVSPWIVYNAIYFHALTFSPAGGPGRQLFEGTWQVEFPGRIEAELTSLADTTDSREELDRKVRDVAARTHLPADSLLRYVHQHVDIQNIWSAPMGPRDRMFARITADRAYWRAGLQNIRRDPLHHAWGRAVRGTFLLWMTEIPVRYSDINMLPPWVIRAIWLPQVVLIVLALAGIAVLARSAALTEGLAMAALIAYVAAVYTPLYSEARYSLPAKPVVLLLATVAVAAAISRAAGRATGRLPPSQSQSED